MHSNGQEGPCDHRHLSGGGWGSEGDQTRASLGKAGLARRAIFASFLNCKNVSEIILKFYLQLTSQHDEFAFILKKQREKQE